MFSCLIVPISPSFRVDRVGATPALDVALGDIVGDGWFLVRRVSGEDGVWHPADDNLAGTEDYGRPPLVSDAQTSGTFSVEFGEYSEMLLTLNDFSSWVHMRRQDFSAQVGNNQAFSVLGSSVETRPHCLKWRNLNRWVKKDPVVTLHDQYVAAAKEHTPGDDGVVLYAEAGAVPTGGAAEQLKVHGGASVYVRAGNTSKIVPPEVETCSDSFLDTRYLYHDVRMTFSDASRLAGEDSFGRIKGQLPTITTTTEARLLATTHRGRTFWLGTQKDDANVWRWSSEPYRGHRHFVGNNGGGEATTEFPFAAWAPGHPKAEESCAAVSIDNDGELTWHSLACTDVAAVLVQFNLRDMLYVPGSHFEVFPDIVLNFYDAGEVSSACRHEGTPGRAPVVPSRGLVYALQSKFNPVPVSGSRKIQKYWSGARRIGEYSSDMVYQYEPSSSFLGVQRLFQNLRVNGRRIPAFAWGHEEPVQDKKFLGFTIAKSCLRLERDGLGNEKCTISDESPLMVEYENRALASHLHLDCSHVNSLPLQSQVHVQAASCPRRLCQRRV